METYGEAVTQAIRDAEFHEFNTRHRVARYQTGGAWGASCSICDWEASVDRKDFRDES
jgi:hypothetical protein